MNKMKLQKIYYDIIDSALGKCTIAVSERGLCSLRMMAESNYLKSEFPKTELVKDSMKTKKYSKVIGDYLNGKDVNLELVCDLHGTKFQKQVWQELQNIPAGQTCYYSELAKKIGKPKAFRAVATTCANNPVALVVPCHRVVPKSGGVGQYLYGSNLKKKLLELEKAC